MPDHIDETDGEQPIDDLASADNREHSEYTSNDGATEFTSELDQYGCGSIEASATDAASNDAALKAEITHHTEQDGVATVAEADLTTLAPGDLSHTEPALIAELRQHGVQRVHHTLREGEDPQAWRDLSYTVDGNVATRDLERTDIQQKGDSLEHDAHEVIRENPDLIEVYGGAKTRGFDGAFYDTRDESIVVYDAKNFGSDAKTGYVNEVSSFAEQRFENNYDKMGAEVDAAAQAHPEAADGIRHAFATQKVRFLVIGGDHTVMTEARQKANDTEYTTIDELPGYLRQRAS
jgi:hypothetical protein